MKYFAHTIDNKSEDEWHTLKDHLTGAGEMASGSACRQEYKNILRFACLLHDLGKYQPGFQQYLRNGGRRGSVPHSVWGAGYASILHNHEISFAIEGHHKGLSDWAEWKDNVKPFIRGSIPELQNIIEMFHKDTGVKKDDLNVSIPEDMSKTERELFTRYIFSTLTDADWLDTENACSSDLSEMRKSLPLDYDFLTERLETSMSKKSGDGELNRLRNQVREYALSKADMDIGFHSMNLPTGMGKTLASVSWALRHARRNQLKRIIIVLPFVNIIDQTSQILKDIFGDDYVLEHHSGNNDDLIFSDHDILETYYSRRLSCENWDYPIIITTTVQFFESLFSNRPAKCRKIHNIADSVVIFDEVQTLPKHLVQPTLTMLKNIHSVMGASFLFCTATMPAFEKRNNFDGIESMTHLVENPAELFIKTRRVNYFTVDNYNPVEYHELFEKTGCENFSTLAVFNTKKSAREFFKCAEEKSAWDKCYHLSTAMCPVHRKEVITNIRKDLENNIKIMVSSTQLIEAGVDFDFPEVLREAAPLESVIQSAGRCNRENRMKEPGRVYLFRLADSSMPDKNYKTAAEYSIELIGENTDKLHSHDFYEEYYRKYTSLFIEPDIRQINASRENFNFKTVSGSYRIIENATKPLYIYSFNEESRSIMDKLADKAFLTRLDYRRMQNFTVQVYENFLKDNAGNISISVHGVMVWYGSYEYKTGISVEAAVSDHYVV